MTTTISSRGQTVIPAEIRARHHLTEQSRLAWIDDGQTIRVVLLAAGANKYGRGIAKDLDLARALRADRAEERRRERSDVVLDTSAILSVIQDEPGADFVEARLEEGASGKSQLRRASLALLKFFTRRFSLLTRGARTSWLQSLNRGQSSLCIRTRRSASLQARLKRVSWFHSPTPLSVQLHNDLVRS